MNLRFKKILKCSIICICICLLITAILFFIGKNESDTANISDESVLIIEIPEKLRASDNEVFSVDLIISNLGDDIYPAASMCIDFDSEHLEFIGIKEGNVHITSDTLDGILPNWSVDVQRSNEIGKINIMYLDVSGGRYAFSDKLLSKSKNVLFRLEFRLRDSISLGDVYEFSVEDAAFAASKSEHSLSSISDTLKIQNGNIVLED